MKTMKNLILSIGLMFIITTSCATGIKFPVSTVEPAAEISAKIKKDKQDNYLITITANYLAAVERLSPPMKTYVVWIVTKENAINNIGQLKNNNGKKVTLETLSAIEPKEIFITAENEESVTAPNGVEISRVIIRDNLSNQ